MGETGIGKTSLIRLLSNITDDEIKIINIHAGVSTDDILQEIEIVEIKINLNHEIYKNYLNDLDVFLKGEG